MINGYFGWETVVVLYIVVGLLILLGIQQIAVISLSFFCLHVIEVWNFLLLISWVTHWVPLNFRNCTINRFLCLNFLNTTRCEVFVSITLWCRWIWIITLNFTCRVRTNLFEKRRLEVKFRVLRTHLAYSHIFSFIFNNNFLEKMVFFSCIFLGWLFWCCVARLRVSLTIQIIQIYLVAVLVFKRVQGAVRSLFQQELRKVRAWYKVILLYFIRKLSGLSCLITIILVLWRIVTRTCQLSIVIPCLACWLDRRAPLRLFVRM